MHIAIMAPDLRVSDFEAGKTDVSDSSARQRPLMLGVVVIFKFGHDLQGLGYVFK